MDTQKIVDRLSELIGVNGPVKRVWSTPGGDSDDPAQTNLLFEWANGEKETFFDFDLHKLREISGIAGITQVAVKSSTKKWGRRFLVYENPHLVELDSETE